MPHFTEYIIEGALLAAFMVSACVITAMCEHPSSRVRKAIPGHLVRRAIIGASMGLTAVALIYSPPGQRSGAHMNPSVTLAFLYLGKISAIDAAGYIAAQFVGAIAGVGACLLASGGSRGPIAHPAVSCAVTVPGFGRAKAFAGEFVISALLFGAVLISSNHPTTAPYTGFLAGTLVAIYILFEAPLSGMSMNPARTLGSAVMARRFTSLWIYMLVPPLAMLLTAVSCTALGQRVYCAKLHHDTDLPCPFHCEHHRLAPSRNHPSPEQSTE